MAGTKRASSTWCILRNDYKLRRLLLYQLEKFGMNKEQLANKMSITPYRVYNYFSGKQGGFTQFQLINACEILKIDVSLDIKITG